MIAAQLLLAPFAIAAASSAAEPPTIVVSGVAQVMTPPDVARVTFNLRGEGATPDAATSALVKTLEAVRSGVSGLPSATVTVTTSEMRVGAVRGDDCGGRYLADDVKLSTGPCAVKGYVATLGMKAEVSPAEDVGTMLGLATRLGADSGHVAEFGLKDPSGPHRQATAAALADARKKAQVIADGSGVKLGPVLLVADSEALTMDMRPPPGATSAQVGAGSLQARPPVAVPLRPDSVATKAQLAVTYTILP